MTDIHGYDQQAENVLTAILTNPNISGTNTEDAEALTRWMRVREEMSSARITRYLTSLKQPMTKARGLRNRHPKHAC